jgi:hypothetical protein
MASIPLMASESLREHEPKEYPSSQISQISTMLNALISPVEFLVHM